MPPNITENALPISRRIDPWQRSVFSVVHSIILSLSGSSTITAIRDEVSITIPAFSSEANYFRQLYNGIRACQAESTQREVNRHGSPRSGKIGLIPDLHFKTPFFISRIMVCSETALPPLPFGPDLPLAARAPDHRTSRAGCRRYHDENDPLLRAESGGHDRPRG